MATLQQRIDSNAALATLGFHLIELRKGSVTRLALVERKRDRVPWLTKPEAGDMYSSWCRLVGDSLLPLPKAAIVVWGARDPEFINQHFNRPVAATFNL